MGVRRAVALRLAEQVVGPCVVGHLKPAILMPAALLTRLTPEELEAILLHELAHIRRNDYLVGLVQSLIKTLYFFNWPVLWISAQIDRERENACDDIAADGCKSRIFYAETLTRFSSITMGPSASNDGELTMAVNGKHHYLLARIRRLFETDTASARSFEGVLSSLLLLALGLFLSVHSQAEAQYPEIDTLDDVSVGQLIETFKNQVTETGDERHIVTTLKPTDDYQALSETEREAFARYFREALWRESYQDMERVEYFAHLEEPEWLEVRQLWFEQNYGHFINALKGEDSIAEQQERRVGDHPNPVRFTRFDSGRMEAEIPVAVLHELKQGPSHELEVGSFVLRHLGSEGVILVMKKGDAVNEVALNRRLGRSDFEDGGIFVGQMSHLSYNDDASSNQVSSFVTVDDFYQVWMDGESLTHLERGEQANTVDALSGFRVSQGGVLEVAFHPARSRYTGSRLLNFMNSKESPYAKKIERELEAKLAKLPSNLHDYLYKDEHIKRHFLAWSLQEGVAIGERQKEYFANIYQKTRVEFLLDAVEDPDRDALEVAHHSIFVWANDVNGVNIYPAHKDDSEKLFDLIIEEQSVTEAVAQVAEVCEGIERPDGYEVVTQPVSLYGYETHCEQWEGVFEQLVENHSDLAAR